MLHNMARGDSGRIVLEINPTLKDELYSALGRDGLTLKDWFLRHATDYLREKDQLKLFDLPIAAERASQYGSVLERPDSRGSK